jgi:hypothetical protein
VARGAGGTDAGRTGGVDCAGDTVPRHSKGVFVRRPAPNYC